MSTFPTSPKKTRPASGSGFKPLKLPFALSVAGTKKDTAAPTPAATILDNAAFEDDCHFFAFKALRRDAVRVACADGSSQFIDQSSADDVEGKTAKDLVLSIVRTLEEEGKKVGVVEEGWVTEKDIISLAESKAQTSIVDKVKRDIYRMVWL